MEEEDKLTMNQSSDNAGVVAPPPLIYAGGLILGFIVHLFAPMNFLPSALAFVIGIPLIVLGFALAFFAIVAMHRADTSPDPRTPTRTIATGGPYRFTRNPIYLGMAIVYLGIACAINALAALALLPVAIVVIHFGVIAREEKYLAQKFGDEYLRYQKNVKRWI